tara:strand:- start:39 stop:230 length:192 start_codon:yes stop_codon:yes gene_type:complete
MTEFTNEEQALAHGLMLAIVAKNDEDSAKAMELVDTLSASMTTEAVERSKVVAERLVMEWDAN